MKRSQTRFGTYCMVSSKTIRDKKQNIVDDEKNSQLPGNQK